MAQEGSGISSGLTKVSRRTNRLKVFPLSGINLNISKCPEGSGCGMEIKVTCRPVMVFSHSENIFSFWQITFRHLQFSYDQGEYLGYCTVKLNSVLHVFISHTVCRGCPPKLIFVGTI